jgi:hypothetical protein
MFKNLCRPFTSTLLSPYRKPRDNMLVRPMIIADDARHGRLGLCSGTGTLAGGFDTSTSSFAMAVVLA